MNKTLIPWALNPDGTQGYTWNPITGCLNHINGMCKGGNFPCYAYRLANTRLKERYLSNYTVPEAPMSGAWMRALNDPFYLRFWNGRLLDGRDELCNAKPRGIFVCDMSDLFGIGIPNDWTRQVMTTIRLRPQHRFYLLTKQPQNLPQFSPFPDNCYVGVTATSRGMAWEADKWLGLIEAKVKYLSLEPLLEWSRADFGGDFLTRTKANWLIIGACTGTKQEMQELCRQYPGLTLMPYGKKWTTQPKIERVEEIVMAADRAGVKVFLKDNLKPLFGSGNYYPLWANDGMGYIRQEMPNESTGH